MFRILASLLFALVTGSSALAEEPLGMRPVLEKCLGVEGVQEAVRLGRARRLAEIRQNVAGDILRADLCNGGETLVYRLTLLDERGRVRRLLLDAATGRLMYDAR